MVIFYMNLMLTNKECKRCGNFLAYDLGNNRYKCDSCRKVFKE